MRGWRHLTSRTFRRHPSAPWVAVGVDWTNNLWGLSHFSQRGVGAQQIINATTGALESWAWLRSAFGVPVPRLLLLLGLDNGPTTTLQAISEEMDWACANYVSRHPDLMLQYQGRPLIVVFDGTGADHSAFSHPCFTVRWMASQSQSEHVGSVADVDGPHPHPPHPPTRHPPPDTGFNERGYWSWMDAAATPVVTVNVSGLPEATVVTNAYFGSDGWTGTGAAGKQGGWTLAQQARPRPATRTRTRTPF